MSRWRRLRRALHQLVGALGAGLVFVATFAASVVLHGDLPSTRRFAARAITGALSSLFEGKLVIAQIDHLGFDGVDVQSAEVRDPWGRRVLGVEGVHARVNVIAAARKLALGRGAVELIVDDVRVDKAEADLDAGPDGRSRIAAAFTRPPKPPGPVEPSKPSKPLHIELAHIVVGHGWVHGEPVAGLPVQAQGQNVPARVVVTERAVSVEVDSFYARAQALAPLNPVGTFDYGLRVALDAEPQMWAHFNGRLGQVTTVLSATLTGRTLKAQLDATRISPDELGTVLPQLQLLGDVSLHGEVEGALPDLHGSARLLAGEGEVNVEADARFVEGIDVHTRLSARQLDPRLFSAKAPAASVGGDARVRVRATTEDGLVIDIQEVTSFPFLLGDQVVPGAVASGIYDGKRLSGSATVFEPGLDARAAFVVEPGSPVKLELDVRAPSLKQVPRARGLVEGSAETTVEATIGTDGTLDAAIEGSYRGLAVSAIKAGRGTFAARLHGPFDRLAAEATVGADDVQLGGFKTKGLRLTTDGPLLSPAVRLSLTDERWKSLVLTAAVQLSRRPSARKLALRFEGGDVAATLDVESVEVQGAAVALRGLSLAGPLRAQGELRLSGGGITAKLHDGSADLAQLARFLGPRAGMPDLAQVSGGTLTFDADLHAEGARRTGAVNVRLAGLCWQRHPVLLDASARVTLANEQLKADASAGVRQDECGKPPPETPNPEALLARASVKAEGTLSGSILDGRSWRSLVGQVQLEELVAKLDKISGHPLLDVERLRRRSKGEPALPVFGGSVRLSGGLGRKAAHDVPSGNVELSTRGFFINLAGSTPIENLDTLATVSFKPSAEQPGLLDAGVQVHLLGNEQELATVAVTAAVKREELQNELSVLLREGAGTPAGAAAFERVKALPVRGSFAWLERPIETLPPVLRPRAIRRLRGRVAAEGRFEGTLDQPSLEVHARVADLQRQRSGGWEQWTLGASVDATLDERGIVVHGGLDHAAQNVPDSQGQIRFWAMSTKRLGDLIWGRGTKWQLDAEATLDRWHLEATPLLAERGLRGNLSGVVRALRMHVQPDIRAQLQIEGAQLYDAKLPTATVSASLVPGGGHLTVEMQQPSPRPGVEGGRLSFTAFPILTFKDRLYPDLDRSQAHPLAIRFVNFDIEPLSPLAAPLLADLRGKLDGEVSLIFARDPQKNRLMGGLRLHDGVLLIPQFGQTLTNGQLNITTDARQSDRETRVDISDVSLSATTGRITGAASFTIPNEFMAQLLADERPAASASSALVASAEAASPGATASAASPEGPAPASPPAPADPSAPALPVAPAAPAAPSPGSPTAPTAPAAPTGSMTTLAAAADACKEKSDDDLAKERARVRRGIEGRFSARIAPNEKIPVTFEGVALGDAHGVVEGDLEINEEGFEMRVAIPSLTFELPDTATQQNVQDLADNPEVGVVEATRRRKRQSASTEAPAKARKILVRVGVGARLADMKPNREVAGNILVRRAGVDVRLAGKTCLAFSNELFMFGSIATQSGRITALGKPFDIRQGFVRFEGQATNPFLNVGATWDAPSGTRVFADLQGYLREAQLRLRSEPARPESEVLALVLFGRDTSASANVGTSSGTNNDNLAVGGGVASTLLNSFIDPVQVFGRRIETRVESTSSRGTSIGVAAEIRPRLWAQVDVSTTPQRERQNTDLSAVTLDWRFRPNWSLRTTVGDRGSSLMELLWQFRY